MKKTKKKLIGLVTVLLLSAGFVNAADMIGNNNDVSIEKKTTDNLAPSCIFPD